MCALACAHAGGFCLWNIYIWRELNFWLLQTEKKKQFSSIVFLISVSGSAKAQNGNLASLFSSRKKMAWHGKQGCSLEIRSCSAMVYLLSTSHLVMWVRWCVYHYAVQKTVTLFYLNNQPDALINQMYSVIKLYMFRHPLCPSSGVLCRTFGTVKFHAGFWWPLPSRVRMETQFRFQAESGWRLSSASKQSQDGTQFHPDSAWKRSSKTCMKLSSAECTVENAWYVSSINMPIFRRKNCIHTASGIVVLCKRLHSTPVESGLSPGTVRLVAQRLNHYATPGPYTKCIVQINHIPSDHKRNRSILLQHCHAWL